MLGLMFCELQQFADDRLGPGAWTSLTTAAGLGRPVYLLADHYPDDHFVALVAETARAQHSDLVTVLGQLGEYVVPDLVDLYGSAVDRQWTALDVLEHAETRIHQLVRLTNSAARPPGLSVQRTGPDEVTVTYASPRRLCALAKGIVVGIGRHYGEQLAVREPSCMLRGDDRCVIAVQSSARAATPGDAAAAGEHLAAR